MEPKGQQRRDAADHAPSATVVIPCFNEAGRLQPDAFKRFLSANQHAHLLFVNDGSTDATADTLANIVASHPTRTSILPLTRNLGKGEAVRAGLRRAIADHTNEGTRSAVDTFVGFWDADLSTSLDELAGFARIFQTNPNVDAVLGSRVHMLGRDIRRNPFRHYTGRVFATGASMVLGAGVYDTQCGAKLFRVTPTLADALQEPFLSRWVFDVELLARLIGRYERSSVDPGEKIQELPLAAWHDVQGSKMGARDMALAATDLLRIAARHRRALSPRWLRALGLR